MLTTKRHLLLLGVGSPLGSCALDKIGESSVILSALLRTSSNWFPFFLFRDFGSLRLDFTGASQRAVNLA